MSDNRQLPISDYDCFARLYDLEHAGFDADLALYRHFARRCGDPVLDVGCGTGRVALALARAGSRVVGIDTSQAMLDIAHARVREAGLSRRVDLLYRDVCELELESRFALAVFALNGFLHLLTVQAQRAALRNIARALLPGGVLIVDLPNPHTVFSPDHDGTSLLRSHFALPEGGEAWCFVNAQTDLVAQIQHLTLTYDEMAAEGTLFELPDQADGPPDAGAPAPGVSSAAALSGMSLDEVLGLDVPGLVRRTRVELDVRFVYRDGMIDLLKQAGLQVDDVYGSYDLDPYRRDSHIMLFVAYRPF